MLLPISEATVSEGTPEHNPIWYRIGSEGYAHSGAIQPVQTRLNPVTLDIPESGALAEVTVPYTDAHRGPGKNYPFAYRFYYQTTYWVTKLVRDDLTEAWYRVADDKWDLTFYVPATHLRLIPQAELTPISPSLRAEEKRLEVRLRQQVVIAYERDQAVFMGRASTGAEFSNGKFFTPAGRYKTFHKRPSRHMAVGDLASNGYDLPGVPWICYITEAGVAFHGTFWHNDFGRPRSHGCINLTPAAARWIYRWTQPVAPFDVQDVYENYGTRVDVVE
jgi:lipoprotein-anchoring transpeptidase ErfK/SrfK